MVLEAEKASASNWFEFSECKRIELIEKLGRLRSKLSQNGVKQFYRIFWVIKLSWSFGLNMLGPLFIVFRRANVETSCYMATGTVMHTIGWRN